MEKNKRNKIIGLSIGILVVLIIVVTSTYAYWQITRTQESPNNIVAACLSLQLENENDEVTNIDLENQWPISDDEGASLAGYTFTVTNNCDQEVNYIVGLNSVEISETTNYMSYDSLKVQLDDNTPQIYGDLSDVEYTDAENTYVARASKQLSVETLTNNGVNTHTIRIWIDENASIDDAGKSFSGQVFITGGQGINKNPSIEEDSSDIVLGSCFTITGNGVILGYDESCGLDVVVPAEVNGIQVKSINNASFSQGAVIALIEANYTDEETGENLTEFLIYYKDKEQQTALETALKKMTCDGDTSCSLEDLGFIILNSVDEIDWTKYTDTKTAALGLAGINDTLHDAGNPGNITSLDLSNAIYLEKIEEMSFYGGYGYATEINNNCIYSSEESMYSCSWNLQSLKLPQNGVLTTIGEYAFSGNPDNETDKNFFFEELTIPASVQTIGNQAFSDKQISTLTFEDTTENPSQLATIGNMAFQNNNLTKIVIPGSVTSIGSSAFADNANLTEVIIKNTEGNVTLDGAFPSTTTITYNPDYTE